MERCTPNTRTSAILVLMVATALVSRSHGGNHVGPVNNGPGKEWRSHDSEGREWGHSNGRDSAGSTVCRTDLMSKLLEFYESVYGSYQKSELFLLQTLGTNGNDKKCLRVKDVSSDNFAGVGISPCENTDTTQILKMIKDDVGGPLIYLPPSLNWKCLTTDSSSFVERNLIYQYTCHSMNNQHWNFKYTSDETKFQLVSSSSGGCLTRDGDDVTVSTCVNSTERNQIKVNNQLWKKVPAQVPWGQLINRNNSQVRKACLRANRVHANSEFADVDLQKCSSDDEQEVKFELGIDNQNAQAISFKNGKLLSVFGPRDRNVQVMQMTNFYKNNQLWQVTKLMNGWLQIRNFGNSYYCASAGADGSFTEITPCTAVTQASDLNSTPLQFWKFKPNS